MSGVAAAIGGSALIGSISSGNAAGKQSDAANQSTALQKQMFDYQKEINAPYQEAGTKALTGMQDPRFQKDFSMSDFTTSPGYQFSLEQGQNALNAANAASGNAVSGSGMAALSKYNVGSADQEYQQAFNNYQSQQNNQFGRLSTLASGGAGANAAMGTAAQGFANKAGSNMIGAGNAQAGATMAGAGAIGQGISQMAGYLSKPSSGNNGMTEDMNALDSMANEGMLD